MAKVEVEVNAKDVLALFDKMSLKKQDNLLKTAYMKGAKIIATGAQYGVLGAFKSRSQKVYDMANSLSYKYHNEGQFATVFPNDNTNHYYGFMAKWFIAGTKNRYTYYRTSRKRKSGKMTTRKYKDYKKSSRGKIEGNDAIVKSYNANYLVANKVIQEDIEQSLIKIWKKDGR